MKERDSDISLRVNGETGKLTGNAAWVALICSAQSSHGQASCSNQAVRASRCKEIRTANGNPASRSSARWGVSLVDA